MLPVAPPVEGRAWLTTQPISLDDLRGQVVVVVFWSFGCEASLLALGQVAELAAGWPDGVTILAVHTPRFPFEDDLDRARAAVARHRIELPVVHDPDYLTWNRYNPDGWPATAVIDRKGRVVGITAGTGGAELIDQAVLTELAAHDRRTRSAEARRPPVPPRVRIDHDPSEGSSLCFPSAVAVNGSGVLAIADTGNDRLLIGPLDADLRTFRPQVELTDIAAPRAVRWASDHIVYVIEGGTGSVLQIDLDHGALDVLADEELAVPTALLVDRDGSLVVADAGLDLLLRLAPDGAEGVTIGPIAGSGFTGCTDGPAGRAELAQPVGLTRAATGIAFCDAASSNVRLLTDDGRVVTVTGNDFFDWGLIDGPAHRARLQRPSGLCTAVDGALVIADTGNNRIRVLQDRKVRTLGLAGLEQPADLTGLQSGHLVIADTGNHRLVVADPALRTGWPLAVYPAVMTSVWA